MATIYILEDDLNIQEIEAYALKNSGYQTEGFDNAREFFKKVSERVPSLLLLDIMLPDADGLDVLRKLRSMPETKKLPIILVTAKTSEIDKVKGLDVGADDYITKPFRTTELIARIYANTRKYQKNISNLTETADDKITYYLSDSVDSKKMHKLSENMDRKKKPIFYLDEKNMQVYWEGVPITLTLSEYRLFQTLYDHRGQILTREQLMEQLWSVDEAFVDDNTLSVYMRRLRQKIDLYQEKSCIATIRGVGYRMREE